MPSKSINTLNDNEVTKNKFESNSNETFGSPIHFNTISPLSSPSQLSESDDSLRPKSSPDTPLTSRTSSAISVKKSDDLTVETAVASVIKLLIPISICMLLVVLMIKFVCKSRCEEGGGVGSVMTLINEDQQTNNSDKAIASIINALVFVLVMSISTFILVLLFIVRFYKVIMCYLIISIGFLLFFVSITTLGEICYEFNIPMDYITVYLFVWNYGTLGLICIFWKGPMIIQQVFLVLNSVFVSVNIVALLPEWTTWTILIALAIWDLIAVLCPLGPLRLLIETFKKRKEKEGENVSLPAGLIYSTMVWTLITDSVIAVAKNEQNEKPENEIKMKDKTEINERKKQKRKKSPSEETEPYSPKLGLGDFVFYSVLVGKASVYSDWDITISCCVGILVGLGLTLFFLAIFKHALPALPVSILFGVLINFIGKYSVTPFSNELNARMIYI